MSTARLIPETWELTGDDAWQTLRRTGRRRLLARRLPAAAVVRRLQSLPLARLPAWPWRPSRGSSPSSAWPAPSVVRPSATSSSTPSRAPRRARSPALLTQAATHAQGTGGSHQYLALILGTVGWLVTATTAMGQLERGLNRLYGVEQDRPFLHKYGQALLLAASTGVLAGRRLRAARLRAHPERHGRKRSGRPGVEPGQLAGRPHPAGGVHRAAVPVVSPPPSARPGRGWPSARASPWSCGSSSPGVSGPSSTAAVVRGDLRRRWPAWSPSCSGRCCRRWPCSSGPRWPPSSKACGPGRRPAGRREGRRLRARRGGALRRAGPLPVGRPGMTAVRTLERPRRPGLQPPDPPDARGRDRRPGHRGQPHRRPAQRRRDLPGHARRHRRRRAHHRLPDLRLLGRARSATDFARALAERARAGRAGAGPARRLGRRTDGPRR